MIEVDWDSVVDDLGPRLFRYFRASYAPATADDLVQQTLLRLIEKVREGRFNPLLGNLRMFAFGIAHFIRLEHLRTDPIAAVELDDRDVIDEDADRRLRESPEIERLRRAVRGLTEVQRSIITLMIDEDLTLGEISIILSLPENTVKSHVHRAKAQLRTLLGEE